MGFTSSTAAQVGLLLFDAQRGWRAIHQTRRPLMWSFLGHTALFALIPAASGFIGTTEVGWQVGGGGPVRLTVASAAPIAVLYYLAMIAVTFSVGWTIHWMGATYGADQPLSQCFALATYSATPLFLVGLMQLHPVLWLNLVVGLPALAYTAYLFFTGVPEMMEIPPERAFLFACAVMAFGLIALVALLAASVLLWSSGFHPAFTR